MRREWELLRTYESREEAEADLERYATTIRNMRLTERHGVRVARVAGDTWGIWLRDRHPEENDNA